MERCGFFDAHLVGNEYDRVYLAEQFASYFASFVGNGVFGKKLNELQVLSMTTPAMQIRVQEGQGWINGYWYENMSELYLPIEVADGVLSRIDSVVLRLGITERSMWIAIKKGIPSYEPVAPDITRNDDYYELQLATIWIGAGYTNIKQSDITDTRWNANACGVVAGLIEQLDTSDYGYQLQSFIDQYTAKSRVDYENYVANLEKLKTDATQDKDNYFTDLQSLYELCDDAYQKFLVYLADLKNNGDASLESLKSWIESLKQSSSAEINRLIEELRGLISDDIVSQLVLRLVDLEQEMPKKLPRPVDSDLTEGVVYLNKDGTTKLIENREQIKKFKYSIILDNGRDANPAAIEYADDCLSFIEAQGSNMGDWANTDLYRKYFRPCVIEKDASEPKYFLQQDNMTLKEDGTPAVLDGTDGDVMIQVKKLYGKVTSLEDKLKFTILNYKEDDSCFCFNEIDGEEKEYIYISAFECSIKYDDFYAIKLNSIVSRFNDDTSDIYLLQQFLNEATEYDPTPLASLYSVTPFLREKGFISSKCLVGYYYLTYQLYQWMFLFIYKTKSPSAIFPSDESEYTFISAYTGFTGYSADAPFCSDYIISKQDSIGFVGAHAVKFLGIENFYGNVYDILDRIAYKYRRIEESGDGENSIYLKSLVFFKDNELSGEEFIVDSGTFKTDLFYTTKMKPVGISSFLSPFVFDDASSSTYWQSQAYFVNRDNVFDPATDIYSVLMASLSQSKTYKKSSPFDFAFTGDFEQLLYFENTCPCTIRLTRY